MLLTSFLRFGSDRGDVLLPRLDGCLEISSRPIRNGAGLLDLAIRCIFEETQTIFHGVAVFARVAQSHLVHRLVCCVDGFWGFSLNGVCPGLVRFRGLLLPALDLAVGCVESLLNDSFSVSQYTTHPFFDL